MKITLAFHLCLCYNISVRGDGEMARENNLKLVGKGSRRLTRMTLSEILIKQYLKDCELQIVIEDYYGEKKNVLVKGLSGKGNYQEDDVICRFKNASDMFRFLQGYHTCFKKLSK